ncbi:DUF3908 family protein [Pseudobacillus badius]|uniref:DUF3908 family protein n=1 Tax=Bacillus badius TaxID=1455 RepID=UPI0007B332FC|nr:DUF3908 family protein [Bacillus badius]KZR58352.1 hypothetical protein A3781_17285 [Bacillus badius]
MAYSLQDFKEDVTKRGFDERSRHYRSLLERIAPYINEENVKWFYPRNVFNKEEKKELIFLFEDHFAVATFQKEEVYKIRTIAFDRVEISLDIPEYAHEGVSLGVYRNGEVILSFHSAADSNKNWTEEYTETIQDLYRILAKQ